MKKLRALTLIIFYILALSSYATSWDEPWRKEIIINSDTYVKAKVLEIDNSKLSAKIEILKCFDCNITDTVTIKGYHMLSLMSNSNSEELPFHLHFSENDIGYFFLKKGNNNFYQLPTPTSGFDIVIEGSVISTFRHSYNMAEVSIGFYEKIYQEIWSSYKKGIFDKEKVNQLILPLLKKKPAQIGVQEEDGDLFFLQHVALETSYLLKINVDYKLLIPFMTSNIMHAEFSASRAIKYCNNSKIIPVLYTYLFDSTKTDFCKVMVLQAYWKLASKKEKKKLWKKKKELSNEDAFFVSNLMDPRIGTTFPSPQKALNDLKKLKKYFT